MKSPDTGKTMKRISKPNTEFIYKGQKVFITYECYLCEDTGHQYTDEEIDTVNYNRIIKAYENLKKTI